MLFQLLLSVRASMLKRMLDQKGVDVAFVRHGQTEAASNDWYRVLSTTGRDQCAAAGATFGTRLKPLVKTALVSPAPRTLESAEIFLRAAGAQEPAVDLRRTRCLYDGAYSDDQAALFAELGKAPLADYLARPEAAEFLEQYATKALDEIIETVRNHTPPGKDSQGGAGDDEDDKKAPLDASAAEGETLLVFGHSVYLPMAALHLARSLGGTVDDEGRILECITREGEGFLVHRNGTVRLLERPGRGGPSSDSSEDGMVTSR